MAMFALTGCVTGPYQQFSDGVGYKSELEKDNIYRVSYTGTQSTGYNKLNDLVFLRSAELAIEKGYDYFIITKASNNRTQITSAMGAGISGVPAHRRVAGLTNKVRPESNLVIKLFKFDPGGEVYNARQIEARIKDKYQIDGMGDVGV